MATAEQLDELQQRGVPRDLARSLSAAKAIAMLGRLRAGAEHYHLLSRSEPAELTYVQRKQLAAEPKEATDADLLRIKYRLGGKYGTHHRRR